jgi:proteasome alpha subunit
MGYDRAITMFSPDGRLLQVEYAKKTVKLGNTAVGITTDDSVILASDKRIVDDLVVPEAVEKIFEIDKHMMITGAGILSDARRLIDEAREMAQQNQVNYDEPMDTLVTTKELCDIKQMTTQNGGMRPFGVSLLVAGIDETGIRLFKTDPTGIYHQYKAEVIGEGQSKGKDLLEKEYSDDMTTDEAFELAFDILKEVLGDDFTTERIDAAVIPDETKQIKRLDNEEIEQHA